MKKLVIKIDKDTGKIEIDAEGFVGRQCELEINKLLDMLNDLGVALPVEEEKKKTEYYMSKEKVTDKVKITW